MVVRRDEATPRWGERRRYEGVCCLQFMQVGGQPPAHVYWSRAHRVSVFCPRAARCTPDHRVPPERLSKLAVCLRTIARHSLRPVSSQHTPVSLSSPKQHVKSNYCCTQVLVRDGSGIGPPRLAPLTPRACESTRNRPG